MWHVIVPVKAWDAAKSRLDLPPRQRQALAKAMAHDTVECLADCPLVRHVSVLTTSPAMIGAVELRLASEVLVQPDRCASLDEALSWAIGHTGEFLGNTAVVVADLPTLGGPDLEQLLTSASQHAVSMVVDRHGTGTTVLAATDPSLLTPSFGRDSATRHRSNGVSHVTVLSHDECGAGARCDVDTLDDLATARAIGLGRHSRFIDAQLGSPA